MRRNCLLDRQVQNQNRSSQAESGPKRWKGRRRDGIVAVEKDRLSRHQSEERPVDRLSHIGGTGHDLSKEDDAEATRHAHAAVRPVAQQLVQVPSGKRVSRLVRFLWRQAECCRSANIQAKRRRYAVGSFLAGRELICDDYGFSVLYYSFFRIRRVFRMSRRRPC